MAKEITDEWVEQWAAACDHPEVMRALHALPMSAFDAPHPAEVLRQVLSADVAVYGWWTASPNFDISDDSRAAGVAWVSADSAATFLLAGATESLWSALSVTERKRRVFGGLTVAYSEGTVSDLVESHLPESDEDGFATMARLVWGLLGTLPPEDREAEILLLALRFPTFTSEVRGDDSPGVWLEPLVP